MAQARRVLVVGVGSIGERHLKDIPGLTPAAR
jgi:hypothetical protein